MRPVRGYRVSQSRTFGSARKIAVASVLALLDDGELDFYRRRASTLRLLRGRIVRRAGKVVGHLEDVIVLRDGSVAELVVANGGGRERLQNDEAVKLT